MWFDILKRQELVSELQAPDSKLVDYQIAGEMDIVGNCCEQARNQVMEAISVSQRRYEEEGRPDRVKDAEGNMRMVENMDCEKLKQQVYRFWSKSYSAKPPKGMKINPELLMWRKIYEEWEECEDGQS